MNSRPWDEVVEEIEKCEVYCSRCHTEWHYAQHISGLLKQCRKLNVGPWTEEEKIQIMESIPTREGWWDWHLEKFDWRFRQWTSPGDWLREHPKHKQSSSYTITWIWAVIGKLQGVGRAPCKKVVSRQNMHTKNLFAKGIVVTQQDSTRFGTYRVRTESERA